MFMYIYMYIYEILLDLLLNHDLSRDTCVVCAGKPQHVVPAIERWAINTYTYVCVCMYIHVKFRSYSTLYLPWNDGP